MPSSRRPEVRSLSGRNDPVRASGEIAKFSEGDSPSDSDSMDAPDKEGCRGCEGCEVGGVQALRRRSVTAGRIFFMKLKNCKLQMASSGRGSSFAICNLQFLMSNPKPFYKHCAPVSVTPHPFSQKVCFVRFAASLHRRTCGWLHAHVGSCSSWQMP